MFIEGRQIRDAIVVANEVVDDLISNNNAGILCKLNMEKAYDRVYWDFVNYMLGMLGFGKKWRKWIKVCIFTTSFFVTVNGGSFTFFTAPRDLRQGDPLSPLLFIIVMKAFNRMLERAKKCNLIREIWVGRYSQKVEVSHLFFADDTLIFCQAKEEMVRKLGAILLCFQVVRDSTST